MVIDEAALRAYELACERGETFTAPVMRAVLDALREARAHPARAVARRDLPRARLRELLAQAALPPLRALPAWCGIGARPENLHLVGEGFSVAFDVLAENARLMAEGVSALPALLDVLDEFAPPARSTPGGA